MKYYFAERDAENCWEKQHFIDEMTERGLKEMTLWPAVIVYGESFFWCDEFQEVGERGQSCGKQCKRYKPRNGKNGRCKHHKNSYTPADEPITLKL
jgi:hypothetical protein